MPPDDDAGRLFTDIYRPRADAVRDDPRVRRRLAALLRDVNHVPGLDFQGPITSRLGIDVPYGGYSWDWQAFFADTALDDILDSITVIFEHFVARNHSRSAISWRNGVRIIFDQQNTTYRVEDGGGVRYRVDAAMTAVTVSTIAALNKPEFGQVAGHLDTAMAQIDRSPADYAACIRGIFFAVEELFKLKFPKAQRLVGFEVDTWLKPAALKLASGKAAAEATPKAVESFKHWVSACHEYRHAKGEPEPAQPNPDLGVLLISQGLSWARWLGSVMTEAD